MAFDSQTLLANLTEREQILGHHSPEGQAIRLLSRALSGWTSGNLAATDVVALSGQAVEDWLKRRLQVSPWSAKSLTTLLAAALAAGLLSPNEAERLELLTGFRTESDARVFTPAEIETVLQSSIEIVEQHWT
jgi:hypothetical protein